MRINNNISALNTFRQYTTNTGAANKSMEKLSSGLRINRAGDDAAGLAISEKMRAQIRGIKMASKNSQDAISLVQTAEGALTETHSILQRMRELSVQSASDTNESIDREALQSEFAQLRSEIDDIASQTKFNNMSLLDGTYAGAKTTATATGLEAGFNVRATTDAEAGTIAIATIADWDAAGTATIGGKAVTKGDTSIELATGVTLDISALTDADWASQDALNTALFGAVDGSGSVTVAITAAKTPLTIQTGANEAQTLGINIGDMGTTALGLTSSVKIDTMGGASSAITTVDNAIKDVSTQRANLGAIQNRLEHKINNLDTSAENLQAAESRIRDVDMAQEMVEFTKNNILLQAAQSMLAQANAQPQGVLQLLR